MCLYILHNSLIRKPLNQIGLESKVRHLTNEFVQQHLRYPSEEELSEIMHLDTERIRQAQRTEARASSLDAPIGDELGLTRERVRQIRERSIEKIRESPHSKGLLKHFA